MSGYSGTPLWKKLGVRADTRLLFVEPPAGFEVPDLPGDVAPMTGGDGPFDVVLAFARTVSDLVRHLEVRAEVDPAGALWICWPKKASGVPTDMTEDHVRRLALPLGWVDNKVCAVDDTWSGLRLVLRVELRPATTAAGRRR